MSVGDPVVLLVETLTDDGNVLGPGARGTVIGFQGLRIVVSWHTHPVETSVVDEADLR